MFRVDTRIAGNSLWSMSGGPTTAQAAWGHARGLRALRRPVEARVVPAAPAAAPSQPSRVDAPPAVHVKRGGAAHPIG